MDLRHGGDRLLARLTVGLGGLDERGQLRLRQRTGGTRRSARDDHGDLSPYR
jgi:hypothetical protein